MSVVEISPIQVLGDNYVWILGAADSERVVVVDPGSGPPVVAELKARGQQPAAILLTHHHGDHVGGVASLLDRWPVPVYGPARESIAEVSRPVRGGDRVDFPALGVILDVIDVPGHTIGHVAYVGDGFVLCGDTLFAGGCGKIFEGTAEQMVSSLDALGSLPATTSVFCAHEYTESNLRFAAEVEPDNPALIRRRKQVGELRAAGLPTVPSTVAEELRTNPFLRCDVPAVAEAAERRAGRTLSDRVEVFAVVRAWKDGWRG